MKCPACKTDMECIESFIGGYWIRCPKCNKTLHAWEVDYIVSDFADLVKKRNKTKRVKM